MPAVSTNGISLHFEITGAGPPLCLISGYRQSSRAWPLPFIARLGERYRIVTFDNRGTGLSDKPADGYDLPNQAKDVLGLLDALGLSRVHLLGFSMGGAVAQQVVAAAPERIDRLILFGTFCGGLRSELASWSVLRRLFVTDGMTPEQAARQMLPVTYSPDYLAANLETVEQQMRRELMYPTPGFAARRQIEALRSFDSYYDLPQVTSATLVATGDCRPAGDAAQLGDHRLPHSRCQAGDARRPWASGHLGGARRDGRADRRLSCNGAGGRV